MSHGQGTALLTFGIINDFLIMRLKSRSEIICSSSSCWLDTCFLIPGRTKKKTKSPCFPGSQILYQYSYLHMDTTSSRNLPHLAFLLRNKFLMQRLLTVYQTSFLLFRTLFFLFFLVFFLVSTHLKHQVSLLLSSSLSLFLMLSLHLHEVLISGYAAAVFHSPSLEQPSSGLWHLQVPLHGMISFHTTPSLASLFFQVFAEFSLTQ